MQETLYPHQQKRVILFVGVALMIISVLVAILVLPASHSQDALELSPAWCSTQTPITNYFTWIDALPILFYATGLGLISYWICLLPNEGN